MKTFELKKTSDKSIFRVLDRNGDWDHYFHKPSGTYLRAVNAILSNGYAKGPRFAEWLKTHTKEDAEEILKTAGERGDRVHQGIFILLADGEIGRNTQVIAEDNKTNVSLSNDEWDCLLAFGEFWNRHDAQLISQDVVSYHLGLGYAGTIDAIAKLTKNCGVKYCSCAKFIGEKGLFDWKSSGSIYGSYGAQVAAYRFGENIEKEYKDVSYTAIVRVGTNHKSTGGYEFEPYDGVETSVHINEFMAAITIAKADYKPFNQDSIKEVPDTISIKKTIKVKSK